MGQLYDACQQVIEHIDRQGLDVFHTRGAIAMRTGFMLTLVSPHDPDDSAKLDLLASAAHDLLGIRLHV